VQFKVRLHCALVPLTK